MISNAFSRIKFLRYKENFEKLFSLNVLFDILNKTFVAKLEIFAHKIF